MKGVAKKIFLLLLALWILRAVIIGWKTTMLQGKGKQVIAFVGQTGKIVGDCQKKTGKTEEYCYCVNFESLDRIASDLKRFIRNNPGLEKQYVDIGPDKAHLKRYQIETLTTPDGFSYASACPK